MIKVKEQHKICHYLFGREPTVLVFFACPGFFPGHQKNTPSSASHTKLLSNHIFSVFCWLKNLQATSFNTTIIGSK